MKRRTVIAGTLAAAAGGALLTPRAARAAGAAFKILTPDEARSMEAVGETLVPGAREQGVAYFIDEQCAVPAHQALLSLRINNGRPPFIDFYRTALAQIDRASLAQHKQPFHALGAAEQHGLIDTMRQGKLADWQGPPQSRVYGIFRDDAVDVVYGTVGGFERLSVPYMAHISPVERW